MYRIIASDMDGTFLDGLHAIAQPNLRGLRVCTNWVRIATLSWTPRAPLACCPSSSSAPLSLHRRSARGTTTPAGGAAS